VVTLKALPDLYSVSDIIKPVVTPNFTSIVLIQNGLDIEVPVAAAFPANAVMSGVSMIGSRVNPAGNHIFHEDPDSVLIGPYYHDGLAKATQLEKAKLFVEIYAKGQGRQGKGRETSCTLVQDIVRARWRKLLWNGTFNTLCTLTRLDVGQLQRNGGTETLLKPAMREMLAIAKAAGHEFPADTVDEMVKGTAADSAFRPSMLVDLEKGNPLELAVILGAPLRYAKDLGVVAPILSNLHDLLSVLQSGLLSRGNS
jgi:2-dehydropantoate 2-reductase